MKRKQIIVANKSDIAQDELFSELQNLAKEKNIEIFKISAATEEGIKELMTHVSGVLKTLPKEELVEVTNGRKVYKLEEKEPFTIIKEADGTYVVDGPAIREIMRRVNMEDNESLYYFHKRISDLGVNVKLKAMGVKEGDSVRVYDYELEWQD